ncbi:hypothetical protein PV10_06902 [Exophiala mesophila]|uniref:Uncharacterized protein n=1 Tax=Exophiala mesophila TaxID=212818 RepID=A0A0D1Z6M0_EXOME|nr:uncharacterized protein PV10_06902 [Exophiala mesophila]KIV89509.1 hypothetical protein PV10_06902 [Exophiala mesophila]
MEHRDPNTTSPSYTSHNSYRGSDHGATSGTPDQDQDPRSYRGKEPRRPRRRRTLLTSGSGPWTYRSSDEEEDDDQNPNFDQDLDFAQHSENEPSNAQYQWNPSQSPNLSSRHSTSPRDLSHDTSRSKGKARASGRTGSSSNTRFADMGSTQPDRRQDNMSSYQTRRQDQTSSTSRVGSSGSASPSEPPQDSRSDRKKDRSDKSAGRSRLVAGVFVRY